MKKSEIFKIKLPENIFENYTQMIKARIISESNSFTKKVS